MKKYLFIGLVAFSLTITTVYALNDNRSESKVTKDQITYKENCPYYNSNEDCPYNNDNGNYPYYNETTGTQSCSNCENGNRHYNHGNGYGRHNGYHHNQ